MVQRACRNGYAICKDPGSSPTSPTYDQWSFSPVIRFLHSLQLNPNANTCAMWYNMKIMLSVMIMNYHNKQNIKKVHGNELQIFYPDTSDVYDRKNMPKLIYCIHALSLFLHKLGKAPLIQNLVGKAEFTGKQTQSCSNMYI